jgi:hypothetical protein
MLLGEVRGLYSLAGGKWSVLVKQRLLAFISKGDCEEAWQHLAER